MKRKIIFVGGIHGAGKGTICKSLENKFDIHHHSASDLLEWSKISEASNKLVSNFSTTQERLINGINQTFIENKIYLLDGHFCLLNQNRIPKRIDPSVFMEINPIAIAVVIEDVQVIYSRLSERDSTKYDMNNLTSMQTMEINYAKELAKELEVPFYEIYNNDNLEFEKYITEQL